MSEGYPDQRIADPEAAHAEAIFIQTEAEDFAREREELVTSKYGKSAEVGGDGVQPEARDYDRAKELLEGFAHMSGEGNKALHVETYAARREFEVARQRIDEEMSKARIRFELAVPSMAVRMFDAVVNESAEQAARAQRDQPGGIAPMVFGLDRLQGREELFSSFYDQHEYPEAAREIEDYVHVMLGLYADSAEAAASYARSRAERNL